MIAPFPATTSRASRPASSEPTPSKPIVGASASPSRAVDWGARLVQFALALYLIPVLVLIFMIGGVGIAVVGLVALAAKAASWGVRSRELDEVEDVVKS